MRILGDQNITESLLIELENLGHEVFRLRELMRTDSPDALVAFLALQEAFVLVTHDKDFRRINELIPRGYRAKVKNSGCIVFRVEGPRALPRMRDVYPVLNFLWEWTRQANRAFLVSVTHTSIQVHDRHQPVSASPPPTRRVSGP